MKNTSRVFVKATGIEKPVAEEEQGSKDELYDDVEEEASELEMRAEFYINARLEESLKAGKIT